MPDVLKVNIYQRPTDVEVWEWARAESARRRTSLSRLIVDLLYAARDVAEAEEAKAAIR